MLAVQPLKKEFQEENIYNQLIESLDLHSYTSSEVAHRATVKRKELLEQLTYKKTAKGSYLMGRTSKGSYFVSSEQKSTIWNY